MEILKINGLGKKEVNIQANITINNFFKKHIEIIIIMVFIENNMKK